MTDPSKYAAVYWQLLRAIKALSLQSAIQIEWIHIQNTRQKINGMKVQASGHASVFCQIYISLGIAVDTMMVWGLYSDNRIFWKQISSSLEEYAQLRSQPAPIETKSCDYPITCLYFILLNWRASESRSLPCLHPWLWVVWNFPCRSN